MSAPHIPNLLDSLRSARGARPARGRGRGGGSSSRAAVSHDTTIQGTDTDAAVSRLSAVDLGYLDDPYAPLFVQSADGPAPRRLPIINRGTYTRTTALDVIVGAFLADDGEGTKHCTRGMQIVSLGAGTDTRPFRLFAQPQKADLIYHEIDFEVTSSKKLRTVQASPVLRNILGDVSVEEGGSSWSSRPPTGGEYYCHGLDLRSLSAPISETESPTKPDTGAEPVEEAPKKLSIPGLRSDVSTLLISECCLCYLSPSDASGVLAYFVSRIPRLVTVIYEPIRPNDAFGKMMVSNLAQRRIRMPTLDVYHEPLDQEARLRKAGFEHVNHMTIRGIWDNWVAAEEKERLDYLEGLDEVEEWHLLADHYIVIWASKGEMSGSWVKIGHEASITS